MRLRGYLILLLLGAGLLGLYLSAVAQERAPWPARPIVPPEEADLGVPTPLRVPNQKAKPPAPLLNPGTDVRLTSYDTPSAAQAPLPQAPAPAADAKPAVPLPDPSRVDGLPDIPWPKMEGPAPPPLFPKENLDPKQIPLPTPSKPEVNAPAITPDVPMGRPDPPKMRPQTPMPPPAPNENLGALGALGAPGPAKDTPRFTFPTDPPSPPQAALPHAALSHDPLKPPAFRVLVPGRRPAALASGPPVEPLPTSTSLRPGALFTGTSGALVIEKRGPSSARVGQLVSYDLVVRNDGSAPAQNVRIEDEIPRNARLTSAQPQPVVQGDRAFWTLDILEPGKEAHIRVDLQPIAPGEMNSSAAVLLGSSTVQTSVAASAAAPPGRVDLPSVDLPSVDLKLLAPERAAIGQLVEFEIRVVNPNNHSLSGLVLRVRLPSGLITSWGNDIEADLGDLPPAGTKSVKLPVKAVQPGRQVVDVSMSSGASTLANIRATLQVGAGGLTLRQVGAGRLVLDRATELQLELGNYRPLPARNIVVTETLPLGTEYLGASERGLYRPETRSVSWIVDYLGPNETRLLALKLQPRLPGERARQAIARAQNGEEIQASGTVIIGGEAMLALTLTDRDDPLELGKETVYEIRVSNQGSVADTNIQVRLELPAGLTARAINAPTAYRVEGQQLVFAPLPRLEAQRMATYQVLAQARAPGTLRVRAQVTSQQIRTPLVREERTLVYQD